MWRGNQFKGRIREVRTSFFEKKEAKKLLLSGTADVTRQVPKLKKVFCFFFTKKKPFPPLTFANPRAGN
jgi:hypothetical protein